MPRLGEIFGWSDNPFYQAFSANRNSIVGGLTNMGADPLNPWKGFGQGVQEGAKRDMYAAEQAKEQEQLNQTSEWLKANYPQYAGLPPAEGFRAAMAEMGSARGAQNEAFFGTGVPIQNADGTISYGQFGSQGSFNIPELPEGSRFLTPVQQLNTGTGFVGVDKFNNVLGPTATIDNFTPAQDKALGQVIGEAAAGKILSLPQTLATAGNMVGTIDGILNDPALDSSTGWLTWMQSVPGTDQYRFGQRALQLQGQAFLQAFESLKGGGQITQIEGEKATQAIGRLSTAQRPEDYRAALEELKGIINAAKQRAISGAQAVPLPPNAAIGGQMPAAQPGTGTTSTGLPWSIVP